MCDSKLAQKEQQRNVCVRSVFAQRPRRQRRRKRTRANARANKRASAQLFLPHCVARVWLPRECQHAFRVPMRRCRRPLELACCLRSRQRLQRQRPSVNSSGSSGSRSELILLQSLSAVSVSGELLERRSSAVAYLSKVVARAALALANKRARARESSEAYSRLTWRRW